MLTCSWPRVVSHSGANEQRRQSYNNSYFPLAGRRKKHALEMKSSRIKVWLVLKRKRIAGGKLCAFVTYFPSLFCQATQTPGL